MTVDETSQRGRHLQRLLAGMVRADELVWSTRSPTSSVTAFTCCRPTLSCSSTDYMFSPLQGTLASAIKSRPRGRPDRHADPGVMQSRAEGGSSPGHGRDARGDPRAAAG